jgi:fatty acid desaturase
MKLISHQPKRFFGGLMAGTSLMVARPTAGGDYAELRRTVIAAGLLKRTYAYYLARGTLCGALLILALVLSFALPATVAWTGLVAFLLGFALIQIALIGHDAGHLAVFEENRKNWTLGQMCWSLTAGVGFWYWSDRHNRHHGHTNDAAADPDITGEGLLGIAFTEHEAAGRKGWGRLTLKLQPVLIALGLLLLAFAHRAQGWRFAISHLHGRRRFFELALLTLNAGLWIILMALLGWRGVGIFIGSHIAASLYLSAIIAPNHKGMPVWAQGTKLSFLERQVLSSRNINSHPVWDFLYGGLNYQVEHHLFPTMPRAHLKQVRSIVKPFCAVHGLPYEEVNPMTSYRMVFAEFTRLRRTFRLAEQKSVLKELLS